MRVIYDRTLTPHLAAWVAERIPECRGFGKCTAQGVVDGDKLVAAVVYHNYAPEHGVIELSAAADSPRFMTRQTINDILEYPFEFCQMIVMQHDPENRIRRMWRRFGADEYVIPRLRGETRDGVISTLTREQWHAHPMYRGPENG